EFSDFTKMGTPHRSGASKKSYGSGGSSGRLIITTVMGMVFGYFIGVSFPSVSLTKMNLPSSVISSLDVTWNNEHRRFIRNRMPETRASTDTAPPKVPFFGDIFLASFLALHVILAPDLFSVDGRIYVPTNPRGAESLPPGVIVSESDYYLRRLWGVPNEDLKKKPKYLVTFTVGLEQWNYIDAAVKKFSEDFQIMLFHYDGRTTEWDQFDWSKRVVHVSVRKQTKWWYAKRFLHPDIVAAYEYIFIWDEDLGVEHFNGDKYIELVKKHGLEISQPGLEPNKGLTWQMTKRRGDKEVHKNTEEKPGWCSDPNLPPCAAFVEIMAPVFSREAWRCVWHMIQNDLVHGWGLDFALRRCVEVVVSPLFIADNCKHFCTLWVTTSVLTLQPAHEKIGVVDSQWGDGVSPWQGVRDRCRSEWAEFQDRLAEADKKYLARTRTG
ncbi:hypothetical protein C3L33_04661, partial [Rhododendron williamsianum]